jgi:aryl-alcohol dehydrogenase-like predicted oxidoreductase
MKYAQLGSSELKISQIAFGCMSLGDVHAENEKLLHEAIERGINFFDTADLYQKGFNEESVGRALKSHRNKVIIATKVGNQLRKDGNGWDWNPRKSYIKTQIHESLRRLRTDYIDLYQLHGGTIEDPIDETIEAFEELKEAGLIRAYGISSIRPNVIREWVKKSNLTSVMMQYSLLDRRPEEECFGLLKENNIGVVVRGALAKGLLVSKPAKSYLAHSKEEVERIKMVLSGLENESRKSGDLALQFVLKNPAVTTIAAGIRTINHLNQNASIFSVPPLELDEYRKLQNEIPAFKYDVHR